MDVFARMRYGDRYFYDNRGEAGSFTGGKLINIHRSFSPPSFPIALWDCFTIMSK